MNKLWLIIALSGYTCVSAAEKMDLSLSQQSVPIDNTADFSLKWRPEAVSETKQSPGPWEERKAAPEQEHRYSPPSMFDRTHRSDRLRITDPDFSSFNSDGGYKSY